jgi:hypothetical protein
MARAIGREGDHPACSPLERKLGRPSRSAPPSALHPCLRERQSLLAPTLRRERRECREDDSPRADQVVRVEPYAIRTKGFGLFVEAMLKGYVEKRETIDLHTEVPRWQEVNWMTGEEVWNAFHRLMEKGNKDSPFDRYKREGVTRAVHVSVVSEVSPNVYRVEWDSTDSHLTEPRGRGHWVSTITVAYQEKAVKLEDRSPRRSDVKPS